MCDPRDRNLKWAETKNTGGHITADELKSKLTNAGAAWVRSASSHTGRPQHEFYFLKPSVYIDVAARRQRGILLSREAESFLVLSSRCSNLTQIDAGSQEQ
jgi:hypothetical protein